MFKKMTFRAHTRYQVTRNQSSRAKRRQDLTDRKEGEMGHEVVSIKNKKAYCRLAPSLFRGLSALGKIITSVGA